MRRIMIVAAMALTLGGCETARQDRMMGGALIGAGTGALIGGLAGRSAGAAVAGGVVGAAAGAIIADAARPLLLPHPQRGPPLRRLPVTICRRFSV